MRIKLFIFAFTMSVILLATSCSVQELSVGKPKDVKIDNISLTGIKISGKIPIENPNNFGFNVNRVMLNISINDLSIGNLNKKEKIHIKPNSNEAYSINYEASFKDVLKDPAALKNAIMKGSGNVKFSGYVKVSKFLVSKKIKIEHTENISKFKFF